MKPVLSPFALRDAPAVIESVFPAQKVSFEAQKEREAQAGQTLTALGSFSKGRKPLILVGAIVFTSLLPATENAERDLEICEKLMAFDDKGLARRALAAALSAVRLKKMIWDMRPEKAVTPAKAGVTDKRTCGNLAGSGHSGKDLTFPR